MSAHGVFISVLEHFAEVGGGGEVAGLAEAVGEFVFEEGGGGGEERGCDCVDGGEGSGCGGVGGGEVFEGEEGAETRG